LKSRYKSDAPEFKSEITKYIKRMQSAVDAAREFVEEQNPDRAEKLLEYLKLTLLVLENARDERPKHFS